MLDLDRTTPEKDKEKTEKMKTYTRQTRTYFPGGQLTRTQTVEVLKTQLSPLEDGENHRVGIFGGTFNPIHQGHLIVAEQVLDKLKLERLYFMPDNKPPHVDKKSAIPAQYRVEMLCLALKDNMKFGIELAELERGGKSYTIDTMEELTRRHPNTQYYFIIGADMVEYLPKWERIDDLVKLVQFVGVKRKGYELHSQYPIITVDIPEIEISSSMIREKVARGESVRYLLPDAVYTYIIEKGLYREL